MFGESAEATVRVCGSLLDVVDLDLTDKELDAAAAVLMANDLVMNSTLVTLDLSGGCAPHAVRASASGQIFEFQSPGNMNNARATSVHGGSSC